MVELGALVSLASDAALAIGGHSRIVAWNERAADLLGYTSDEVLDRPCGSVLQALLPSGEPLCTPECEGRRCFERHSPFGVTDCGLRRKDGRLLRASISTLVSPTDDCGGSVNSAIAVVFLHPREDEIFAPRDGRLQVFTLGRFGVSAKSGTLPVDRWHRRHSLTLLKILVNHCGEAVQREHLIECLWPTADPRRGRERLKVATYFLRKQLRAAGAAAEIVAVRGAICALKRDAIWIDSKAFEESFNEGRVFDQRGSSREALRCFEQAMSLYKGDYLPDDLYADWCAEERERLREVYLDVLGYLIDGYLDGNDYARAIDICRLGLVREPYRESFHRALMTCYSRLGQRERVVAHYRRCEQVLKAELGIKPAPETERLYRELAAADGIGTSTKPMRR